MTANTDAAHAEPAFRASCRTKIFLGYTSNLISAGVREQIRCVMTRGLTDHPHGAEARTVRLGCACMRACFAVAQ